VSDRRQVSIPRVFWPNRPIGSPVTGKGIPPLPMISDDHDPATAFVGALDAHHKTKGAVMVTSSRHLTDRVRGHPAARLSQGAARRGIGTPTAVCSSGYRSAEHQSDHGGYGDQHEDAIHRK
jgi:hypothetical protein